MLDIAVKARIPLVAASTSDLINLPEVLSSLCGDVVTNWDQSDTIVKGSTYYKIGGGESIDRHMYGKLVESDAVLILVNPSDRVESAFDAGEIPVPKALTKKYLMEVVDEEDFRAVYRCVRGLTIKQMVELIKLTQAEYGGMEATHLMAMRSQLAGKMQGLNQVHLTGDLYVPNEELVSWLEVNGPYFMEGNDERLVPRGILFHGHPGVGKTQGSKFIAKTLGVPLYRLDLSSSLGRYVGESESNLARVLSTIDQEEPCVLLIDEVEKIFRERDDSGVTSRLLSQLLWWLQEHTSRVFVSMTTNGIDLLPQELYRAGRIDKVMFLDRLGLESAYELAFAVLETFLLPELYQISLIRDKIAVSLSKDDKRISHADVVAIVHDLIKKHQWVTVK